MIATLPAIRTCDVGIGIQLAGWPSGSGESGIAFSSSPGQMGCETVRETRGNQDVSPVILGYTNGGLELFQGTATQLQRRTAHTLDTLGTLLFNKRQVAAACGFKNLDRHRPLLG